jgi:succinate dehydrogenase / fumarate reductase iron-sulfur subunit
MIKERTFIVYRQENRNAKPRYERYSVPISPGMTVLEALYYIQDHYDSTLAFRYSCRGAICGSCGVTVNKFPVLACKTQVSTVKGIKTHPRVPDLSFGDVPEDWDPESEILVEPMPNMKVIRDLIVDMERFWQFYREIQPYFTRGWKDEQPESQQAPNEIKEIEHLVYCILCGLCWTCPVEAKNKDYLGPAQLAKADRFIADTRLSEEHRDEMLKRVAKEGGVPACEKIFACNAVCPKGVQPGTAIQRIRKIL